MTEARADATPVPELSGGRHFPCLDAYRAMGMTLVLLTHAAFATGFDKKTWIGQYVARFDVGLPMFFVLSGFLLYLPFVNQLLGGRPVDTRSFYRRRVLRVVPGYWVAVVGVTLIWGYQVDGVGQWAANLLLLPAFGVDSSYLVFQSWSVGVEVTFYLLLPLYAFGLRRLLADRPPEQRFRGMLAGALVLYLLGAAFRIGVVAAAPSWDQQSLLWFPMYLDFFAIGMAFAVISARSPRLEDLPRPLAWFAVHPGVCWAIAFACFLAIAQIEPPEQPFGIESAEYLPRQFGYGVVATFWLLPAFFGPVAQGRIRGFLRLRPMVYLGVISYSFYLWHLAFVDQAKEWTVPDLDQLEGLATFTGNFWVISAVAWVCTFLVASVLYRAVERPFLQLKDRPLRDLWRNGVATGG